MAGWRLGAQHRKTIANSSAVRPSVDPSFANFCLPALAARNAYMRAKMLHLNWQSRRGTRARVLGQVWDGCNERGHGTRFSERHQRLFLETLRQKHRQTRDFSLWRGALTSIGLRRSRSSSSALMTRDMKGERMEASRAMRGEERGGEDERAAPPPPPPPPPPPSAGVPAVAPPPASDDPKADRDEAADKASASSSFLKSLASPKARPMLLSSSKLKSTATLSVIFSFLSTALAQQ